METHTPPKKNFFEDFSAKVTKMTGSTPAFLIALALVLIWLFTGPMFDFSETWQLVINTGTTIITFLMVFLIQKSQNKDSLAIQLKLNELVAANEYTSNRLVSVEDMTEEELKVIQKYYKKLSQYSKRETNLRESHSIDEAEQNHEFKLDKTKPEKKE
ncbi:MAG: low affinity iron permease family protein [Bacteroidota bacterium]|jgi:low affinity Fe/Cu permease|nr:low affinity iron permease family protein [Bacteroidota bacterium]